MKKEEATSEVGTKEDRDSDHALFATDSTSAGTGASSSTVWPGRDAQAHGKLTKDDSSSAGVLRVRASFARDNGVRCPSDTLLQNRIIDSFLGGLLQRTSKDQAISRSGREAVKVCLSSKPPGRFGALSFRDRTKFVPDLSKTLSELDQSSKKGLDIEALDFTLNTALDKIIKTLARVPPAQEGKVQRVQMKMPPYPRKSHGSPKSQIRAPG